MEGPSSSTVICHCRKRCGSDGKYVSERTKLRHLKEEEEERAAKRPRLDRGDKPPIAVFLEDDNDERNGPIIFNGSSSQWTQIGFTLSVLNLRANYPAVSQQCVTDILSLFKRVLDDHGLKNTVPRTYKEAVSKVKELLPRFETCHVCKNDCVLYTGDLMGATTCPKCNEPRFDDKGKPKKEYSYFPMLETVRNLYAVPKIASMLQEHGRSLSKPVPRYVSDIRETAMWKELYREDGPFKGDPRSLALGYSTDGGEPWNHLHIPHSIWPQTLKIFNLPPEVRDKLGFLMLMAMIQGPKCPQEMNAYHQRMVMDIKQLHEGIEAWDSSRKEYFTLYGDIIAFAFDWPARNKCTNHQGHRAEAACPYCHQKASYSKEFRVTTFDNSRRFLEQDNQMRSDSEGFPKKAAEHRGPPPPRKYQEQYGKAVDDLKRQVNEKKSTGNTKGIRPYQSCIRLLEGASGKKGREILYDIPTYDIDRVPIDFMHTAKNIAHSTYEILTGTKQNFESVCQMEETLGRFRQGSESTTEVFQLTRQQMATADRRLVTVKTPVGYDFKIRTMWQKAIGVKSLEWIKFLTEGLMKYSLRGMLPPAQRATLFELCDTLQAIGSPVIDTSTLPALEARVNETFSRMERDFPRAFRTLMWHLPHHMVEIIRRYGPITCLWMAPFERYMKFVLSRITSRKNPVKSCLLSYQVTWLCNVMAVAGKLPMSEDPFESGDLPITDHESGEEDEIGEEDEYTVVGRPVNTLKHLKGTVPRPEDVVLDEKHMNRLHGYLAVESRTYTKCDRVIKYFSATSRHPRSKRLQDYRCEEIETRKGTKSVSSVVGMMFHDSVYFGRIQHFILVDKHEVPCIKWYGKGVRDEETKLWTVKLTSSNAKACSFINQYQHFRKISKPLVHATEEDTLYILDCHDTDLC